jgi:peroxiredoxin
MRSLALLLLLLAASVGVSAQALEIGGTFENFKLQDTTGKSVSLNDLKGKNGSVVIWLSAQCPVVKGYHARINEIAAEYAAKGINFIGINSNKTEDLAWVKSDAEKVGYKFPMLIDAGGVLAKKVGATVTPEVFYLDKNNVLLYHGAIDNDRSGRNPTELYLKTAFDASLGGKKIERTRANAFGCSIKF